jgi:hypothetical protein
MAFQVPNLNLNFNVGTFTVTVTVRARPATATVGPDDGCSPDPGQQSEIASENEDRRRPLHLSAEGARARDKTVKFKADAGARAA